MKNKMKKLWADLGRNIFVGVRLENNLKGLRYMAVVLSILGAVMFTINIVAGAYLVAMTSVAIIIAGAGIFHSALRGRRDIAFLISTIAIFAVFTYDVFCVGNNFAYLWILLVPLAVGFFFSARAGIFVSLFFQILFTVAFYSPVRVLIEKNYLPIVLERFPILLFFHMIVTGFVLVQYHRSILDQMDYENELEKAKNAAEKAKETAEKANTAKSDFLANMSHEIRTPINAVLGMNEMIHRESLRSEQLSSQGEDCTELFGIIKSYSENIESAGRSLLSLINDILDLSRIEAGRMTVTEAEYSLGSFLNDVCNMMLFKARSKGLEFFVDTDKNLPQGLLGDELRVKQVVINILNNAVKYTENGMIRFSVRLESDRTVKAGDRVNLVFSVEDTGVGIKKEDLDRLFTKFERVNLEHNSTVEGSGLGLTITRELLSMMNGDIFVSSEYGKGSVFTVTIPQTVTDPEFLGDFKERFGNKVIVEKKYSESFRAPNARILVVDDTRLNLIVVEQLLKQTGIGIDVALSGAEAIEKAAGKRYDVILMDQRMPEMSGTEAMRRIKESKDALNASTPVICLTANALAGARKQYLSEGFDDYLSKPINGASLETTVLRYLSRDKVEYSGKTATVSGANTADQRDIPGCFLPLTDAGIDPVIGLGFCQGDEEFYRYVLSEFAFSASEKTERMQNDFKNKDWRDYAVQVHAVKSTSHTIGATALSDLAFKLETSAENGGEDFILENHEEMISMYESVAEACRNTCLPGDAEDGGEILEFFPGNCEPSA